MPNIGLRSLILKKLEVDIQNIKILEPHPVRYGVPKSSMGTSDLNRLHLGKFGLIDRDVPIHKIKDVTLLDGSPAGFLDLSRVFFYKTTDRNSSFQAIEYIRFKSYGPFLQRLSVSHTVYWVYISCKSFPVL